MSKPANNPVLQVPLSVLDLAPIVRVRSELAGLITRTSADELIVASHIHDHAARVHSYEIVAAVQEN